MAQTNEMDVLAELRDTWRALIEGDGGHCPVCDRWGKYNSVNLTRPMVNALVWLCNKHANNGGRPVHLPTEAPRTVTRSYSLTRMKHWGLVRPIEMVKPTKEEKASGVTEVTRTSGLWKPTALALVNTTQS